MTDECSDPEVAVRLLDEVQARDTVDVDEDRGGRQPQFHHRDQALAPGQHPCLIAALGESGERLGQGVGRQVVERCRVHFTSSEGGARDR